MPRNPLLRRPTSLPAAPTNRYERFGWTRNPFPDRPGVVPDGEDPRSNGSIYVDSIRRREQDRFEELLIPTQERAARTMAFLLDMATRRGRGIGKTAFLNHQRQRVMADLGRGLSGRQDNLFAAHVFPPGGTNSRKFWQFARLLINTFNEQNVFAELLCLLRAFSGCIPEQVLDQAHDLTTIGNDEWLRQQDVAIDRDLVPTIKQQLTEAGVGEVLAEALAKHGHSADRFRIEFLLTVSEHRWRQQSAQWLTNDLVTAFRLGGFHRGLVFVDDFEKIVLGQNTAERRTFADDIRYSFVEGPTRAAQMGFYGLLWVVHPYVEEILIRHWNAAGPLTASAP